MSLRIEALRHIALYGDGACTTSLDGTAGARRKPILTGQVHVIY